MNPSMAEIMAASVITLEDIEGTMSTRVRIRCRLCRVLVCDWEVDLVAADAGGTMTYAATIASARHMEAMGGHLVSVHWGAAS